MFRAIGTFGLLILITISIAIAFLGMVLAPENPLTWIFVAVIIAIPFIYNAIFSTRFLSWKNEYNTGNEEIDNEHKKLLAIINQLITLAYHDTGLGDEETTLDELVTFTASHIEHEEKLMRENNYSGLEAYKQKQSIINDQLKQLKIDYAGSKVAIKDVVKALEDGLIAHIKDSGDKQFFSSVKS